MKLTAGDLPVGLFSEIRYQELRVTLLLMLLSAPRSSEIMPPILLLARALAIFEKD
jgi:hypothetical protein